MALFKKEEKEEEVSKNNEKVVEEIPQEKAEVLSPEKKEIEEKEIENSNKEQDEEDSFPMIVTENQLINMKLDEILRILTEK